MLPPIVSEKDAKEYKAQMQRPDLVFINNGNKDKVEKRIAPHVKAELERKRIAEQEYIQNLKNKFEERNKANVASDTKQSSD